MDAVESSQVVEEDNPLLRGQEDALVIYSGLNWVHVCVPKGWRDDQILGFLEINGVGGDKSTTLKPSSTRFQCGCNEHNHHLKVTQSALLPVQ